jgi:hypothetical protein
VLSISLLALTVPDIRIYLVNLMAVQVGAAKGGLDGNVLIMSAVEHGASLGGTRRKGGRGPSSPSPVAAQQVICAVG